jgi:dTDP-4-amino-4,6-dideoxygalactose transaminase
MLNVKWLNKKTVDREEVNAMLEICESSNQFTNGGRYVERLEEEIRKRLGIDAEKAVVACNNGTSAIHAVVSALNFHYDRHLKWATQSFTFPSSAQGVLHDALIVDVDRDGGLDLDLVPEEADGLVVTNVFGNLVDIDKYVVWAREHEKFLLFDNAATGFSFYRGQNACNYGLASTVSFHHTKPFGFGEGGAIIIDRQYEKAVRRISNFGIDNVENLPWNRWGSNYKMSEIAAVFLLQFWDRDFDRIVRHHRQLYRLVKDRSQKDIYELFPDSSDGEPTLSCFCLISRHFDQELVNRLKEQGVECRKYYHPLTKTPQAERFYQEIVCLPCHLDVSVETMESLLDRIEEMIQHRES